MANACSDAFETIVTEPIRRFQNVTNDSETYTMIWLRTNFDINNDNFEIQKKLKRVINDFKSFDDLDECIDYLSDLIDEKVIFIVADTIGCIIIPFISDFPQLKSIYIYKVDKKIKEEWTEEYEKVIFQ